MRYEREPSNEQRSIIEEPRLDIPLKVVAGAGTGKTFVLGHRFVWLVANGEVRSPERILTLTFTDNAAGEMRLRIKRLLRLNGQDASGDLWIHTFHSFAARLIGECSYEAGLSPEPQLLTEIHQRVALENLLEGILAWDFSHIAILHPQRLVELGFARPEEMRDVLRMLIERAKRYGLSPEQFRQQAFEASERFWAALPSPEEAWALGDDREIPRTVQARLEAALDDPTIARAPVGEARATAELRKLYFQDLRQKKPRPDAARLFDREQEIEHSLVAAVYAAYSLYQQQLAAADAIDFDDQIMTAVQLLTNARLGLADRYRQQFDYILVDEFQDTSPAQMAMLEALAHPTELIVSRDGHTRHLSSYSRLMVVGDQKQSIYAWRNARPENLDRLLPFNEGETVGGSAISRPLTETYRLAERLTASANRAGQRARAADPLLQSASDKPGLVVKVTPFAAGEGETARHARRRQAAYVAESIQQLIQEGQFDYGDICVLMRRRWEFRHLKKAFEDRQIPYQSRGGVGFFDHPLARDMFAFLQAICNPFADESLIRLLTRPPVCLTDRQLFLLATSPGEPRDVSQMRRCSQPIIAALQALIAQEDNWRSCAERRELPTDRLCALLELITDLRRQSLLRPAREILEHILADTPLEGMTEAEQAAAPTVKATLEAVINELESEGRPADVSALLQALQLYQQHEGLQLPAVDLPAHDAVQTMTIHQAKGLGFPAVFVLGWSPQQRPPLYDEHWGLLRFKVDGAPAAKQVCHKLFASRSDELQEEARLWYVALTRAERFVCVTFVPGARRGDDLLWAEDLEDAISEDGLALAERQTLGPGYAQVAPLVPTRLPIEAQPPRPSVVITTSFTALQNLLDCPLRWWIATRWRRADALCDPREAKHGGAIGASFHAYVAAHYRQDVTPDQAAADDLITTTLSAADVAARDRLQGLIAAFAASPWAALRPAPHEVERPVHLVRAAGAAVVDIGGVVDLLLPEQSEFVDFKTNWRLDDSDLAHDALQMHIYQQALLSEPGGDELRPVIVHVTANGLHETPLDEAARSGQAHRLDEALGDLTRLTATPQRPSAPQRPPCAQCPFANVCPETPLLRQEEAT